MLEKQKDIDAVVIATPDHTHAVIAMAAIHAGKHVYCQKPLSHDIYEARALAGRRPPRRVATQMGIQGHCGEGLPPDLRVDSGRSHRRSPRRGCVVLVDLLSVGARLLEFTVGRGAAERHAAAARQTRLGPLARAGATAAVPPRVSSGGLALLVGFRQRHDGRPRRPHTRLGGVRTQTRTRPRASKPRRRTRTRKLTRSGRS